MELKYNEKSDIWSAGCVALEILNKSPLLMARNSIEHLVEVIKILGTPSEEDI